MVKEIKPALTAEEWADGYEGSDVAIFLATGGRVHVNVLGHPLGGSTGDPRDLPALAALCLHGQPFGFTRDMLRALRELGHPSQTMESMDLADAAIDRIEALLPTGE